MLIFSGTPLQNNLQELFNLLNFLDEGSFKAKEISKELGDLSKENIEELHRVCQFITLLHSFIDTDFKTIYLKAYERRSIE